MSHTLPNVLSLHTFIGHIVPLLFAFFDPPNTTVPYASMLSMLWAIITFNLLSTCLTSLFQTPPKAPKHPPTGPLGLHAFGGHNMPPLSSCLPTSLGGVHPTPLSALTAAARSPSLPGLQPPVPTMGGPIRRRISDKAPMPMTNGQ